MTDLSQLTKKSMGEPVAPTFTDNELKVKRNILVLSAISLLIIFGLKSTPDTEESVTFTLFFIRSSHIDFDFVFMMLLVSLVYLLSNYCWLCTEYIAKWKIRVSGTKNPISKPSRSERFCSNVTSQHPYKDHNDSAEQSNLYSYLQIHQLYSDAFIDIKISEDEMKKCQEKARLMVGISKEEADQGGRGYAITNTDKDYWHALLVDMRVTRELIQQYKKVMDSPYLIESIKRFDENFLFFQNSQYRRHFIMELLPTFWVGFIALFSLVMKTWFTPNLFVSITLALCVTAFVLYILNQHHKKNS
ncbi:TPA: hypothetical protein I7759_21830 [Vibrio vulnificus]|nr:hypothetical protein [Vibrio vulnificus]HAS8479463.1 hypothetical protein [Vibrio vulnificus]